MNLTKGILEIQKRLFRDIGHRIDAHYKEGYGALFVLEGTELIPQNVIYVADEIELSLLSL